MSDITAIKVSQKIHDVDTAIRQGLQSGNIADVMQQKRSDLVNDIIFFGQNRIY
jgi:hypothetical protein